MRRGIFALISPSSLLFSHLFLSSSLTPFAPSRLPRLTPFFFPFPPFCSSASRCGQKEDGGRQVAESSSVEEDRLTRFDRCEYRTQSQLRRLVGGSAAFGGDTKVCSPRRYRATVQRAVLVKSRRSDGSFFDLLLQALGEARPSAKGGRLADFRKTRIVIFSRRTRPRKVVTVADARASSATNAAQSGKRKHRTLREGKSTVPRRRDVQPAGSHRASSRTRSAPK